MATVKSILVVHPKYGELINETFMDEIQFSIFLKMLHISLASGDDFTTYNGNDFLIYLPNNILKECLLLGTVNNVLVSEVVNFKSKLEE